MDILKLKRNLEEHRLLDVHRLFNLFNCNHKYIPIYVYL